MWEKVKSGMLVVLVITSIMLTGWLWIGTHSYERTADPSMEEIAYGDPPMPIEQVKPDWIELVEPSEEEGASQYYLWRENDQTYERAWDFVQEVLEEIWGDEGVYLRDASILELDPPYLVYRFREFPLSKLLEGDALVPSFNEIEPLDHLVVSLDSGTVYLTDAQLQEGTQLERDVDGRKLAEIKDDLQEKDREDAELLTSEVLVSSLEDSLQELLLLRENQNQDPDLEDGNQVHDENTELDQDPDIPAEFVQDIETEQDNLITDGLEGKIQSTLDMIKEKDIQILVPQKAQELDILELKFEDQDREKLAKAFFLDLSFVRKIEERDKTIIYTDGQRGLRFYANGAIEYNAPQKKGDSLDADHIYKLLNRSAHYISLYGGWDENLRLSVVVLPDASQITQADGTHELSYRYYHQGVPIINQKALTLHISDRGVVRYYRCVPSELDKIHHPTSFKNLTEVIDQWIHEQLTQGEDTLKDVADSKLETRLLETADTLSDMKQVSLGYELHEEQNRKILKPMWVIEFFDQEDLVLPARLKQTVSD